MPGNRPENGDVYSVYRNVTTNPITVGNTVRPMACVASRKFDTITWTAIARSSTDGRPNEGDVYSPAQPTIGLDKEGHWSLRWLHSVLKDKTGTDACAFRGHLPSAERDQVLRMFRGRQS